MPSTKIPVKTWTYERRLGRHHFAYLRAWCEGVPLVDALPRYLPVAGRHGHELAALHRTIVGQVRTQALRLRHKDWHLVGVDFTRVLAERRAALDRIGEKQAGKKGEEPASGSSFPSLSALPRPDLAQWLAENGEWEDFSEVEQLAAYEEAHPPADSPDQLRAQNRLHKASSRRERKIALLRDIEAATVVPAALMDPVSIWFEPDQAKRLISAGFVFLGDLVRAVDLGGAWYKTMPGVGKTKAVRMESFMRSLLPAEFGHKQSLNSAAKSLTSSPLPVLTTTMAAGAVATVHQVKSELDGSAGVNRSERPPLISANNDQQAMESWLSAVAKKSIHTSRAYRREAERFMLWCVLERMKPLSSVLVDDCVAYMEFLNDIPRDWMSRAKAARMAVGWTPFRGQPSSASRMFAVKVVSALFTWLSKPGVRYLDANVWEAVDLADAKGDAAPIRKSSRAFTPEAFDALLSALPPGPVGATRNGFILAFGAETGLRASEFLSARVGDFSLRADGGYQLHVVGKGKKMRDVTVNEYALEILLQHLVNRGHDSMESCPKEMPLLARNDDTTQPLSYPAAHQSFAGFVQAAIARSTLPLNERLRASKGTLHWLRHTYATRAVESGVPPDVVQAELGHESVETTANYYQAQERRRWLEIERAARQRREKAVDHGAVPA